jgi:hypothetical protein
MLAPPAAAAAIEAPMAANEDAFSVSAATRAAVAAATAAGAPGVPAAATAAA